MYCIYTDTDVSEEYGNYDHIVPLALGGDNGFCVWSDKNFNSEIGSKIDGALSKDPLIMLARYYADARGHSDTPPVPVWKRSVFQGRPVQVSLGDEVKVWDAKANKSLPPEEFLQKRMESTLRYDYSLRSKFTGKVALGGGYFLFGDTFLTAIDCEELRRLLKVEDVMKFRTTLIAHDPVLTGRWPNDIAGFRLLCGFKQRTTFIALPRANGIAFHVGVLGMYVGSIFCPGNVSELVPEDGEAIILGPGPMERLPLPKLAEEFSAFVDSMKAAQQPKANDQ
jgi:hypothetical protein